MPTRLQLRSTGTICSQLIQLYIQRIPRLIQRRSAWTGGRQSLGPKVDNPKGKRLTSDDTTPAQDATWLMSLHSNAGALVTKSQQRLEQKVDHPAQHANWPTFMPQMVASLQLHCCI